MSQQMLFADRVRVIEVAQGKIRSSADELDNLFHSLLQRAFRGELCSSR
jgi:hypothetical protein